MKLFSRKSIAILASASIGILAGGLAAYYSKKKQTSLTKKLSPIPIHRSLAEESLEKKQFSKSRKRFFLKARAQSVQGFGNIFIIFY